MLSQNLNCAQSNHISSTKQKNQSKTLGSINSHITVTPVLLSNCQRMTLEASSHIDHVKSRERLADVLCRNSHEALNLMKTHRISCVYCRPAFTSYTSFYLPEHHILTYNSQQLLNNKREVRYQKSKQLAQMGDASETQSTSHLGMSFKPI